MWWRKKKKPDWISDVKRLVLKDGDVLIFKCPGRLPERAYEVISKTARNLFGEGVKIAILEEGMDVGVISKDA